MDAITTLESCLANHCRTGHFVYESGDHGDLWIDLDGLLADPPRIDAWSGELANRLKAWSPEVICGPQAGGARLAECVARQMDVQFVDTSRDLSTTGFSVCYRLPDGMHTGVHQRRVAVIDDAINAGSAVSATLNELTSHQAHVVAIGCLLTLNEKAQALAEARGLPLGTLLRRQQSLWRPTECPICNGDAAPRNP